jgi:hypothetical protein
MLFSYSENSFRFKKDACRCNNSGFTCTGCGSYYTQGTAFEKILGTPFKYAEVPKLYNKPLKIVGIGGCEKLLMDYDIINTKSEEKKGILQYHRERNNIEFVSFKQLIWELIK